MISNYCLGNAIEWHLRKQGKFEGASISTGEIDGKMTLTNWEADSPMPSDAEIAEIINEYEAFIISDAQEKLNKKAVILSRIGITEEELKIILT